MKKIVHLLNRKSFLPWIKESFDGNQFDNTFILLDLKNKNLDREEDGTRYLSIDETGKEKLLNEVNASDVAIHYFLDYTKSEIILKSDTSVKHYWCFFGADIYQQLNVFKTNLYQEKTKRWLKFNLMYRFRLELRAIKYKLFKRKATPKQVLLRSLKRIEKVLWYVDDEIEWINSKIELPEFLYYKFYQTKEVIPFDKGKVDVSSKKILIGNSSAMENNHLDVLELFKKLPDGMQVALPLVYGEPQDYKQAVIERFKDHFKENVEILEERKTLEEYYAWLDSFPTAIMLHNRQQGLGNIFYLIANGSKLYLSDNNIIFKWLKKNNIEVSSFEKSFEKDYHNNELTLGEVKRVTNFDNLKILLDKKSDFKKVLLEL